MTENQVTTNEKGKPDLEQMGAMVLGETISLLPNCKNFNDVLQLCTWVAQSKVVPEAYRNNPADIFVAASYGSEIGLPFMTAIQKIAVINGRPALPSDIKLAMVRSKKLLEKFTECSIKEIEKTGAAWCEMKRVGVDEPMFHSFTVENAKMAGLWERRGQNNYPTPWVTYKYRMLQLKARDMVLRDLFGDVFFGMASVEEAQEAAIIEHAASPEGQLEEKSQPDTKGKEILEAPKPALNPIDDFTRGTPTPKPPAEEPVIAKGQLTMKEEKPSDSIQQKVEELAEMPLSLKADDPMLDKVQGALSAIAQLVDGSVEQLRKLPGGGPRLMALWQKYKMPTADFGKKPASSILPEPELALFGNEVQQVVGEIERKAKK
jgi:hypothetical protein